MTKISVKIKFEGRTAFIHLSDGTTWSRDLEKDQTEQQFCDWFEALLLDEMGDKIHKMVKTTEYTQ